MPSLWGSKNGRGKDERQNDTAEDGGGGGGGNSTSNPSGSDQQHQVWPDEYTRLLPNRLDSEPSRPPPGRPYLTPDDPAVTPYNLWTVRLVRRATVLFALLSLVWWVLQFIALFVTPPSFHTRGSAFWSFSYASLALFTVAFTLVFFAAPSKAVRILSVFMVVMLFSNVILTLAVERTRHEEAWVGIASVVWALVMSLWALLADRTVELGKAEEEERLTGRAESRRSIFEWSEVLVSTVAYVVLSVVVVLLTLTLILRALDAGVAPPGKRYWVDGGKYQVHVYCHGNTNPTMEADTDADAGTGTGDAGMEIDGKGRKGKLPTVLLEGGEDPVEYGLWEFAEAALQNGSIGRYCFADRPGFAFSDTAPSPMSVGFAVDALSEALARADEDGPWVLVGAGVGSLYSRVFSARHGGDVRGMLLVDPLHEDLLGRLAAPGRGFLLWLRGIVSPLGLDRLSGAIFRGRTGKDRVWGRSAKQGGKLIFAKLQESLVAGSLTRRDVDGARAIQRPSTPLAVISSGVKIRDDRHWEGKQRDLARLTRNLKHWDVVEEAPHRVWDTLEGREKIEKRLRQLVYG